MGITAVDACADSAGSRGPQAGSGPASSRRVRVLAWIASLAILASLLIMIGAGLVRSSWMSPHLVMPGSGPPWEIHGLRVPLPVVTIALWLAAILAGIGVTAGLLAVRAGYEIDARAVFAAGLIAVAVLTVQPPVGSSDALDYVAYGRMVEIGRTPYVMTPAELKQDYPALGQSIPLEWDHQVTVYGPMATAEQFVAVNLGGSSPARVIFWLKLFNAAAFVAVALIVHRLLRRDAAARLRAHLLWTVNPLLLWGVIAAGHFDVLPAAAGLLGLLLVSGQADRSLARAATAGILVGAAADTKIIYVLFGVGLCWQLRRRSWSAVAAVGGMLAILVPTYLWFGPPAVNAVLARADKTTADNFYQFFTGPASDPGPPLAVAATVIAVLLAALALWRLPDDMRTPPGIKPALALSAAFLFVWPYQMPWYDAMLLCLLVLYPATRLDWLVLARLTAATIALMPGNPWPPAGRVLAALAGTSQLIVAPAVLLAAALGLAVLCAWGRLAPRASVSATTISAESAASPVRT